MIARSGKNGLPSGDDQSASLAVVDIGNSSFHLGVWSDAGLVDAQRLEAGDWAGLDTALSGLRCNSLGAELVTAVIACVVPESLKRTEEAIDKALGL